MASGTIAVLDPGTHHPTHPASEILSTCFTIIGNPSLSMSTRQNAAILPNDWTFGLWEE